MNEPTIVFVGSVTSVTKQTFTGNLCDGTPCNGTGWTRGAHLDHEHPGPNATRETEADETATEG